MTDARLIERWPGYTEQSWAERFAELDRQFRERQQNSIEAGLRFANRLTELTAQIAELKAALEGIAGAVRLGAETDLLAWRDLAEGMRLTARRTLEANP